MSWYGKNLYYSQEIKEAAKQVLALVPPGTKTLLSTGSSGCALASAMLTISNKELYHVYIRKPNEKAHSDDYAGGYHESSYCRQIENPCTIVDDILATGRTIRRIIAFAKLQKLTILAVCVGQDCSSKESVKPLPKSWNIKAVETR